MNKQIFSSKDFYNGFNAGNQVFDPSLSFDENEFKFNKNDNTREILLLNKLIKEKDYYNVQYLLGNNQLKLENYTELNNNFTLLSTYNTQNPCFLDNAIVPPNEQVKIYKGIFQKEKIFNIVKINKKIGRIKKDSLLKGKHDKLSQDNIIRKIKGRFHEKLRIYINEEYKKYISKKYIKKRKMKNWLKKINPKVSRKIKKEENMKWFKLKIYEIFSENVSIRYSSSSPDYNKKKINNLFSLGDANDLIEILNSNVEDYFRKYVNDEKIEGFKTLKDDIKELRADMESSKQNNINEYLKKYEYTAKNLKEIFNKKNPRRIHYKKDQVELNI
jgi:hypothetical protein